MSNQSFSILVAASEASPLASTGGLAEVAGSLPLALRDLGAEVAVTLPAYRRILDAGREFRKIGDTPVRLGGTHLTADILQGEFAKDIPLYLVRRDEYFDRRGLYGGAQGEYFDNPERYIFFSRAIPALCPMAGFTPDVIIANDWQTGLVMAMLNLGALPKTAGMIIVHNQGYLGLVPKDRTHNIGLPERYYTMNGLEYFGQMSLLKAGILYADAVVTVSPTYAFEVRTPEGGSGLDGVMQSVSTRLHGILNGVDYSVWNPETDQNISARFSSDDLSGKIECKSELLSQMNLPDRLMDRPLLGMVSRLDAQKGINLLAETAEEIFKLDTGLVILGSGDNSYIQMMKALKKQHPDRVGLKIGFDPVLAHKITAGADIILMPSMYEPCGLAQLFGLRYGTVPVVRATGGLNDTVKDPEDGAEPGTGFKFGPFQSRALLRAVRRAVEVYENKDIWQDMMRAGMAEDFSWDRSARQYMEVIEQAVAARRGG